MQTSRRELKVTTRNRVILTTFEMKRSLEYLTYFINGNKNLGVNLNGEAKVISSKSIVIKFENPSLLHGYDFFFNLMKLISFKK